MSTDPQTFRRRPAEIQAVQWLDTNGDELAAFAGPRFMTVDPEDRTDDPDATAALRTSTHESWTLLLSGDWVVKSADGGFGVRPGAAFAALYEPAAPSAPADRAGLRERIAEALISWTYRGKDPEHGGILETVRANAYSRADAVLSVLPPAADRAAVLLWAADRAYQIARRLDEQEHDERAQGAWDVENTLRAELRRLAAEAQQQECALCGHRTCMLGKPCGVIATEQGDLPEGCGCTGGEEQQAETQAPTPEQVVRDHVTTLHLIGEQLAGVESWMWGHLANVRDAAVTEQPQCDAEFEGGGTCAKPAGHRPPGSDDPHVPAAPVAGQPPADTGEEA